MLPNVRASKKAFMKTETSNETCSFADMPHLRLGIPLKMSFSCRQWHASPSSANRVPSLQHACLDQLRWSLR
jgi:hypothetical protein